MTTLKHACAALVAIVAVLAAATAGEPQAPAPAEPRGNQSAQHPPIYLGVRYSHDHSADL